MERDNNLDGAAIYELQPHHCIKGVTGKNRDAFGSRKVS